MAAARLSRTRRALQKLTHIDSAIGRSNPAVATAVTARIRDCAAMLALNPRMGGPGRIAGAREFIVLPYPYILAYRQEKTACRSSRFCTLRKNGLKS